MRSWEFEHLRHALYWVATRLKQADRRVREARLARPGAFWAAVFGIIPVAIVIAIFISGTAGGVWAAYHSNREDIIPLATFVTAIGVIIAAAIALMLTPIGSDELSKASVKLLSSSEAINLRFA
jgi:hypothetical protein